MKPFREYRDAVSAAWDDLRKDLQPYGERLGLHARRAVGALQRYLTVIRNPDVRTGRKLLLVVAGLMTIGAGAVLVILLYAVLLIPFTPGIGTLQKSKVERPSVVLSADGEVIARFRRVNREWVALDDVSDHVVDALVATEDHRFYRHPGVDPIRILGALAATLGGERQGGSTITQQLARNMFPEGIGRSVSLTRKLKEMITAFKIEIAYSKDEILEAYLNTVPFYFGAYGIEMAARTYFGKPASELDLLASATLVGMLKGTYYYNPVRNPQRALIRRNVALRQMVKRGYLTDTEYERMEAGPIRLNFVRQEREESSAPHFTEHLRMWLVDWADRRDYNIYRDSLVIHTTLDMDIQEMAERAVQQQGAALQAVADVEWGQASGRLVARHPSSYIRYRSGVSPFGHFWATRGDLVRAFVRRTRAYRTAVEAGGEEELVVDSLTAIPAFMDSLRQASTRLQAALVAIDPGTGYVKAWVGSRDYEYDQYDHVARARRQPGSTFKPFVYARALDEGYTPQHKLEDREVEIPLEGGYVWRPANAGETVSGREMTVADGLVYSKNTITAQLVNDVGPRDVARLARRMGVNRSELRAVPSLALGTSEVSLLEMVSAYSTFAELGVYREPLLVTRIEDRRGIVVEEFEPRSQRAVSERTARAVIDMMRGVVDRGTGSRIRSTFGIAEDVAGKTGTTQNGADGWFILMHSNLVAGSWVGFNDPRVTFRSDYWGQGGNNALFIVGDFFQQVLRSESMPQPEAAFPAAPEYDEEPSIFVRAMRWIRDVATSAWEAVFGAEERAEPQQSDTYVAGGSDGSVQINFDESEAVADSLNRMERESNRLDSLIRRLSPDVDTSAVVETGEPMSSDADGAGDDSDEGGGDPGSEEPGAGADDEEESSIDSADQPEDATGESEESDENAGEADQAPDEAGENPDDANESDASAADHELGDTEENAESGGNGGR